MLSAIVRDYLKAIYYRQEETDGRVKTSAIAEYMDGDPSTVPEIDRDRSKELPTPR